MLKFVTKLVTNFAFALRAHTGDKSQRRVMPRSAVIFVRLAVLRYYSG